MTSEQFDKIDRLVADLLTILILILCFVAAWVGCMHP